VALGLVAVYHVWLGRVSGGVDVFLFLSAFFLTGTFVRRLEGGRPLRIPHYWLHTFKRLLPPSAVTILLVLAGTAALLPPSQWVDVMQQAVASAVYLQNALLALMQVDYQNQDAGAASPLQHFWSLSVQGQAFVVWPLLFLLVRRRARRGRSVRLPLIAIVSVIGAASLVWSVLSTQSQQQIAYFDTAARMWEFAAGSLLALTLPLLDRLTGARRPEDPHPPRLGALRALLGWAGILALLAVGVLVDVSSLFPGWIALWPLAAAGAVVVAGHSGRRWGADALLSTRPAAFVGDISYALYLVHWPILVIWLHHSDQQRAGMLDGLAVLTGSVLLAWALTRLVDAPIRRSRWLEARPWRSLTAIAVSVALVAVAAGAWSRTLTTAEEPGEETIASPALPTDEVPTETPPEILPHGWELKGQWPKLPENCSGPWEPATTFRHVPCDQLLPADAEPAGLVVILGSSHARQYVPALLPWAEEHDLQIVNLHMDGCDFVPGMSRGEYCDGYDEYALDYIDAVQPDVVLTTSTRTAADSADEEMLEGMANAVEVLTARGIDVLSIRDNPRWEENAYECAEAVITEEGTAEEADEACGADASAKYAPEDPAAGLVAAEGGGSLTSLDFSPLICPDERCSPVLGDTYVYMDDDHLSKRFVQQVITPAMTEALEGEGGPRSIHELG
jgi:peptidoglycan/LPS O-acetylase OafA/YrhL